MKKILFIISSFLLVSCFTEPKKEDNKVVFETNEVQSSTESQTISTENNIQSDVKRFAYVVVNSKIPQIYNGETYKFSSNIEYTKEERTEYFCNLSFKDSLIISEIIEIENYDIETEQSTMLKFKNIVKDKLFEKDRWLLGVKLEGCKNPEDLLEIRNSNPYSKILNTQIFVFNSYSEANENKKKMYSKM